VDARIEELRNTRGTLESKGDAPAEAGDWVTFDFHGTMDGAPFDGGTGENQRVEVGAGQYLPDFDAQFPGIQAGEAREADMTFPEDYAQANLRGKAVHFTITAKQVERKAPAALDEAFFKQFGDHAALKDFQTYIKAQLEDEHGRAAMQTYQNQLADQMREQYHFEVPQALVEQGLHELEHRLSHDDPEALKDEAKLATLKEAERGKIEANLRVAYAVDVLAKEYEVKAEPEEVRQRFYLQAYMMQQNPAELVKTPFGRRMLMQIEQSMITAQALERLAGEVLKSGKGKAKGDTEQAAADEAEPAAKGGKAAAKAEKTEKGAKPEKADKSAKAGKGKGKAADAE